MSVCERRSIVGSAKGLAGEEDMQRKGHTLAVLCESDECENDVYLLFGYAWFRRVDDHADYLRRIWSVDNIRFPEEEDSHVRPL